jgi:hypothetical protein
LNVRLSLKYLVNFSVESTFLKISSLASSIILTRFSKTLIPLGVKSFFIFFILFSPFSPSPSNIIIFLPIFYSP